MHHHFKIKMKLRIICLLFNSPTALEEVAESCLRVTPQIAISPEAIFLEIGKCAHLYREETVLLRLQSICRRFKVQPQIGIANLIPEALARARFKKPHLPIEALIDYASPFSLECPLQEQAKKLVIVMRKLGIFTLDEFEKIPIKSIVVRFGKLGLLLRHLLSESAFIPWPPFCPQERCIERSILEETHHVQTLESVLFIVKRLIDRAMARLRGLGRRALKVTVTFKLEPYSIVKKSSNELGNRSFFTSGPRRRSFTHYS